MSNAIRTYLSSNLFVFSAFSTIDRETNLCASCESCHWESALEHLLGNKQCDQKNIAKCL